jgi:hypothetical protein
MRIRTRWLLPAAIASLSVLAQEALSVKPGYWETTTVTASSGMPQMPAEALARIPAEQRAQMEAMMKRMGSNGPSTHTDRSCVTAEDIKEGMLKAMKNDATDRCERRVVKATAQRHEYEFKCGGEVAATGRMVVEVQDSEHVRGEMDMKSPRMNMNIKFTSRRLGTSCPKEVEE